MLSALQPAVLNALLGQPASLTITLELSVCCVAGSDHDTNVQSREKDLILWQFWRPFTQSQPPKPACSTAPAPAAVPSPTSRSTSRLYDRSEPNLLEEAGRSAGGASEVGLGVGRARGSCGSGKPGVLGGGVASGLGGSDGQGLWIPRLGGCLDVTSRECHSGDRGW